MLKMTRKTKSEPLLPTRVFLMRHGVVTLEHRNRFNGSTDSPLDAEGEAQFRRLADYLAPVTLTALYASPLMRSRCSAENLGQAFGLEPKVVPDLREMCFGLLEGLSFGEVNERYPEELKKFFNDPGGYRVSRAETMTEVQDRAWSALERIVAAHPDQSVAVVAHGAVNRTIMTRVLDTPLQAAFNLDQDYACLNVLDFYPDRVVLKGLNLMPGPCWSDQNVNQA